MIDKPVDAEPLTGNIPVPPAHIWKSRQLDDQLRFEAIHTALFRLIQRFPVDIRACNGVNAGRKTE